MSTKVFECGSCGHETDGYTQKELVDDGWEFQSLTGGRTFVLCAECVNDFRERRRLKDAIDQADG